MGRQLKLLHREMPKTWWMGKKNYFIFMMRELSSIFVAAVAVGTILQVKAIMDGSYAGFVSSLQHPAVIVFAVIALAFALLHTVTFFTAAGQVIVVQMGENRVPRSAIIGGHFAAWLGISAVFAWIVLL